MSKWVTLDDSKFWAAALEQEKLAKESEIKRQSINKIAVYIQKAMLEGKEYISNEGANRAFWQSKEVAEKILEIINE